MISFDFDSGIIQLTVNGEEFVISKNPYCESIDLYKNGFVISENIEDPVNLLTGYFGLEELEAEELWFEMNEFLKIGL